MSNRTIRVNELMQRELNAILRTKYQSEAVAITVTEVRVAPDLRDARVFVAIMGDDEAVEDRMLWLKKHSGAIRLELGRRIVLKFLPRLAYVPDVSGVKSGRILGILDDLEGNQEKGGL